MTKDDQRVRETVQAELRRRRGALDRSEEQRSSRAASPGSHGAPNGHGARPQGEERRDPARRQWSLPPPSGTSGE